MAGERGRGSCRSPDDGHVGVAMRDAMGAQMLSADVVF